MYEVIILYFHEEDFKFDYINTIYHDITYMYIYIL